MKHKKFSSANEFKDLLKLSTYSCRLMKLRLLNDDWLVFFCDFRGLGTKEFDEILPTVWRLWL